MTEAREEEEAGAAKSGITCVAPVCGGRIWRSSSRTAFTSDA
jgi:hypothetical protein